MKRGGVFYEPPSLIEDDMFTTSQDKPRSSKQKHQLTEKGHHAQRLQKHRMTEKGLAGVV
jgi:hypothetical protein